MSAIVRFQPNLVYLFISLGPRVSLILVKISQYLKELWDLKIVTTHATHRKSNNQTKLKSSKQIISWFPLNNVCIYYPVSAKLCILLYINEISDGFDNGQN